MDWSQLTAIGTIILAIATFLLVIATLLYANQSRKQTIALFSQLNLQKELQIPHLVIRDVQFKSNSIKIDIQNVSNTPASWVGLETQFYIVGQRLYADKLTAAEIGWDEALQLRKQGKMVYFKYYWLGLDSSRLSFENQVAKADAVVNFFYPQGVSRYFPPNSTISIDTTPSFLISMKEDKDLPSYKKLNYDDFKSFLLANNIRAVAVVMELLSKDTAEIIHNQGCVASFVLRTDFDKSLEDSSKNAQHFDFIPLSVPDWFSAESWMPSDMYKNIVSEKHVP